MTIAQHALERQVAEAVDTKPYLPTPKVAQVLLIARTNQLAKEMRQKMARDAGVSGRVVAGTLKSVLEDGGEDWAAIDFVVFEISDETDDLLAVAKLKALVNRNLHAIAVTDKPVAAETSARFKTAGVHQIITLRSPLPVTRPEKDAGGQMTVVMRARGGAGATTVAVNLAAAQAMRSAAGSVALVDLDIQNGTIGMSVDLPDSAEATNLINGTSVADADFLTKAMQRHSSGMDVLTAPDVFAPLTAITPVIVATLLEALKQRYDFVVIDMPQAVMDWVSPVLDAASQVIVVSDMTLPALKRAKRLTDLISEEHMTLPVDVAINFERRPLVPSAMHKEAAHLLGGALKHWIPNDQRAARRATDMGIPMVMGAKRSRAANALRALGAATLKPTSTGDA